jgi:hypothetical protein
MVAKVRASQDSASALHAPSPSRPEDQELEAEIQAVAAWFDALPAEWQRYFDDEATSGRRAYGPR